MSKTTTITAIRTILRSVPDYKRDSSAPVITKEHGEIYIFFHHVLDQVELASRCVDRLRAHGFYVINNYPELVIPQ